MTFQLTVDHLLWRMRHVHGRSTIAGVDGSGAARSVEQVSFAETVARVEALAAGLAGEYAVTPGSTVAVLAFNTRVHVELLFAVPLAGARVECLNVRMAPDVLVEQVVAARPAVVVVDREVLDHPVVGPAAGEVLQHLPQGARLLSVDAAGGPEYDAVIAAGRDRDRPATPKEDDVAFVFHTSGTTGRPKTYTVRHRDVVLHALSQAASGASCLSVTDRVLPLAPLFHVNGWGLPFTAAITGSDLVLIGGDLSADRVADVIADLGVTVAAAVPTVWHDVCRVVAADPRRRPAALREVLSGGSAVPQSVVDDVGTHLGARVATAWGMTETMACSTYERAEPAVTAGMPIPLVEMRVLGLDGEAGPGEHGRLQVRGAFVIGAEPEDGDGWMTTGDIASFDEHGRLVLHDREKDLIKSGGEWIASAQIEQQLCALPGVEAAAVVARPDPRWVERPVAYVVVQPASGLTDDILRGELRKHLPAWWVPDAITIIAELPTTAVGKIDKAALRRAQNQSQHSEEVA